MDNLFLALLTLFFTQGFWRGNHPGARVCGLLVLGALAAALVSALR